jgi:hypothetical protein
MQLAPAWGARGSGQSTIARKTWTRHKRVVPVAMMPVPPVQSEQERPCTGHGHHDALRRKRGQVGGPRAEPEAAMASSLGAYRRKILSGGTVWAIAKRAGHGMGASLGVRNGRSCAVPWDWSNRVKTSKATGGNARLDAVSGRDRIAQEPTAWGHCCHCLARRLAGGTSHLSGDLTWRVMLAMCWQGVEDSPTSSRSVDHFLCGFMLPGAHCFAAMIGFKWRMPA